jgi:hypothetical protein
LPANFAMPVAVSSTSGDDAGPPEAGLAARVAAGPGLWEDEDWLAGLRRESLPESLLADGTIAAGAAAEHGHKQERALNAVVTALCLVTGALFPVLGYDPVLALVFNMPGLPARPGTPVPTGPACSKARARSREAPARAMFGHDAARRHSRRPGRHRVRPGDHPDRRLSNSPWVRELADGCLLTPIGPGPGLCEVSPLPTSRPDLPSASVK